MKLKPSVGCHSLLAAVIATLATVAQLFAADPAVTISWSNPADIVYGTALSSSQLNATFSTSTGGAVEGTASYEPQLGTFLPAGSAQTLKVTWVPKDANQGVSASTKTVVLNVSKAPLTATVKNVSAVYGSAKDSGDDVVAAPAANVTYSGFVRGEDSGQIQVLPTLKIPAGLTNSAEAGTAWAVSFDVKPVFANYTVSTVNGTLTVGQKPLTFTLLNSPTIQFGATPTASGDVDLTDPLDNGPFGDGAGGRGIGWVGDDLSAANVGISHVHSVTNASQVGAYDISVVLTEKKAGLLSNYDITINNGTYTVSTRTLTVTLPAGKTIQYGVAIPEFVPAIAMENAGTWTLTDNTGSADARKLDGLDKILTAPVVVSYPAADSDVKIVDGAISSYEIKTSGGTVYGSNFTIVHDTSALTITKAPLTIAASNRTKITGAELPTLSVEFPDTAQFKHGDSPESVFNPYPPKLKYDVATYAALGVNNGVAAANGVYADAIIFEELPGAGLASNNYTVTTVAGDLTITLQPIQFSWAPTATTLTYGDQLSAAAHLNAASASTVTVGGVTKTIPVTTTYTLVNAEGVLVAGPLAGGTLVNDVLAGGTQALAANGFSAGTAYIKVSVEVDAVAVAADADLNGNVPDFGAATETKLFAVSKKALTVTANDQTRVYNTEVFDGNAITFTADDFVGGETDAVITTDPTVTNPTTKTSNVGDYSIIPSGGEDDNYAFVFKAGKLSVTAAATAVTWDPPAAGGDATKHLTYGTALSGSGNLNPTVAPEISGTWSYSVSTTDATAMTYPSKSVVATFTPDSNNYSKSTATKVLNVKRLDVDVAPDAKTVVYGDALPGLTGQADFLASDGITTTFQTGAFPGSPVGTYLISAKFDDSKGRLKNYNIKLASNADENSLTITPATLHVTAQNASSAVLAGQATLELKLDGLKAESAVLNGIALNAAELADAFAGKVVNYNDGDEAKTVQNNLDTLDDRLEGYDLLERVFLGAGNLPSLTAVDFSNAKEATFTIKVGNLVDADGNNTALTGNYVLGTVTNASYGVGKINATIAWNFVDNKGTEGVKLAYGTKIGSDQLTAGVTAPVEGDNKGTWSYTIGGTAASGQLLSAGKHTITANYTPHSSVANVYLPTSATKDVWIAPSPLKITIAGVADYVYGDPLPFLQTVNYVYGSGENNANENFINGDTAAVFTQQPVVVITPKVVDGKLTDYSVANSPADISFVQQPAAKNYTITTTAGNITINKRPLTVKPADVTIAYGAKAQLTLEYINLAPGETSADLATAGFAYLGGEQDTSKLAPGTYTIYSGGAYGENYVTTHATGTLTVAKEVAQISISDSSAVYDGTGKAVTVATTPSGLATTVTYDGASTLPVDAGTYEVAVTIADANYSGSVTGTLEISPAPVTITLSKLAAKYNGSAKAVGVKATPAVGVEVTYDGAATAPSAVGNYAVVAKSSDANYSGEATGTLVIDKGTAFIIPSNFTQMADGTEKHLTIDTDPAGLETTVSYTQVNPAIDAILLDFGNEGDTASGTPGSPWQGFSELVVDEAYDLGNGITMTAQGDGFSPNNPAGSGADADYDGITVPVAARDDYLFKTDDTPGGTAKLVFNGLPAGVYSVTMFEGRTTDANQIAKLWAGGNRDEPAEANVASFAGGGTTVEVTVAEGDTLYYLHMEDGSGGISGMIIRNVSRPDTELTAPVEPGIYSATITVVDDSYQGSLTTAMGIIPGASISFGSLSSAYTGSANPVQVVTDPVGLNVSVTYSKSPNAPSVPGTYPVVATIVDDVYSGTVSGDYVIEPAAAEITLSNLNQPFNSAVAPTVTTSPAGLATIVTYNGELDVPTQPGEYEVEVTVIDTIYAGSATGTLSLGKGAQSITFPAIPNLNINGVSLALVLNASSSSGLPITYNVLEGGATLDGNILTINQPGIVTIVAQQLGNEVFDAAEEKSRFFNVTGTGIPLGAAQSVASLDDDGNLSVSTSGQPFQQMSVYRAGEVNGEFTPILKVMLDENGQSTFKTETNGDQGYFQVK